MMTIQSVVLDAHLNKRAKHLKICDVIYEYLSV